ncbi:MAG: response regulator [bacterium]|nr:response regulator [bacterium]
MPTEKRTKIMMVDDSSFMLSLITDMLKGTEFEIVGQCQDGSHALELYDRTKPDIVLLDVVLPEQTGPEVLDKILDMDANAKVIMVSSLGTEDIVVDCLRRGAKHFIQKPFDQEHFLRELREMRSKEKGETTKVNVGLSFKGIIMGVRFFGQYLLEKHRITKEQLLNAITYQKNINISLEQLLIQGGHLNGKDVMRIKNIQKKDLDKDLPSIILEEKLMPKDKLDELIAEQKKTRIYIGEALVKTGAMNMQELDQELKSYKEEESKEEWEITKGLEKVKNQIIIKSFIDYTIKIFQKIAGEMVKVRACVPAAKTFTLHDYTFEQVAKGNIDIAFIFNLSEQVTLRTASVMYGKEIVQINEAVIDAVKEFLNIIDGNSCAKLSSVGLNFTTLPPVCYDNRTSNKFQFSIDDEYMLVSLISTMGDFDILVKSKI